MRENRGVLDMQQHPISNENPMPIKIRIPSPLRSYTNGVDVIEAEGTDVGQVLDTLKVKAAGLETRLFKTPGQLNRFINIFVNDEDIRHLQNLQTPVKPGDEVSLVPAIAGG
jgi:molybdopterin synthase sulfur carrier subunit